ncbi:MAG: C69 family dipeptidase [Kiritimatiellia bacterium]|nr:C69 family dipeptidase [Kiritimatiellia bacterium]
MTAKSTFIALISICMFYCSNACDTWVAPGNSTTSGWMMLGKNSDRPRFGCQPLVYHARRKWPAGSEIDLVRVKIPQVEETFTTIGSCPYWCWGYEEGINEYSVAIGNEAIWTKVLSEDKVSDRAGKGPKLGPTGMALVRLGLERGRTAREALNAIAKIVEVHGQHGSASPTRGMDAAYHNSFIIADPEEAWILETTGNHWVARKVTVGPTSISNGLTLGSEFDLASVSLVQHAVTKGWWPKGKEKEFHFQHAYSPGTASDGPVVTRVHRRAKISRTVLEKKGDRVDVRWMMQVGRTPGIDLSATASSSVAVLPDSEDQLPVYWWCPARPSRGCFVPFFIHGKGLPEIVSTAGTAGMRVEMADRVKRDTFSGKSYWWLFRDLDDKAGGDSEKLSVIRETFDALEKEFEVGVPAVIKKAVQLRKDGQPDRAAAVLDSYTGRCLDKVLLKLNDLRERFE